MGFSEKEAPIQAESPQTLPTFTSKDEEVAYEVVENRTQPQNGLGFWTRMGCTPESFKRRTLNDKHNQLNQTLKSRHLHMIAIGGSIGAGFFVGSGAALSKGGPATVVIDFLIIGVVSNAHHARLESRLTNVSLCR